MISEHVFETLVTEFESILSGLPHSLPIEEEESCLEEQASSMIYGLTFTFLMRLTLKI